MRERNIERTRRSKNEKTRRQVVRQRTFLGAEVDDLRVSYSNTASFFFFDRGTGKKKKKRKEEKIK